MAVIQHPDEQMLALRAKAASVGLSLEDWRAALSAVESPGPRASVPWRRRYKIEELIAQCDPTAPISEGDRAWLESAPAGNEVVRDEIAKAFERHGPALASLTELFPDD